MTATTALDIRWAAVRAGLLRGWIETRQNLTETAYVIGHAIAPRAYVAVLPSRIAREMPPAAWKTHRDLGRVMRRSVIMAGETPSWSAAPYLAAIHGGGIVVCACCLRLLTPRGRLSASLRPLFYELRPLDNR